MEQLPTPSCDVVNKLLVKHGRHVLIHLLMLGYGSLLLMWEVTFL